MKKRKRLIWQIYPSFLLITIISVTAVSWYAARAFRHFYYEQTANDLNARGRLLVKQITHYLTPMNQEAVDQICKETGRKSLTRITVVLENGRVIGDTDWNPRQMDNHANRPEIVSARSGRIGTAVRFSDTLGKNMMYVAIPIPPSGPVSAVLRTSVSVSSVDREVRYIQLQIVLGGVLIALVIAGISLYVTSRLSRPLVEMKRGAVQFAEGNLKHRLPFPESEEMAELAEALNRMAAQLDDRIRIIIEQRNELETVLSSMEEGVIAIDKGERVLNMNQAAAHMFQIDATDIHGKILQEIIRNTEMHRLIVKALSEDTSASRDITLYQNGERILNAHTTPLRGADENRIGTLVVLKDVTHVRKLETMRRDFVANVSHEIKTPLTAIKGFVETLHQGSIDRPDEAERFLGIIEKHANRLSAIIDDLLKLSRIEQEDEGKKISLERGPIKGIIQSAIQVCQSKADAKQIAVHFSCEDGIQASVDSHLIEQAAVNLMDNAIKYSEKESDIRVEVKSSGEEILICFQDHGIGIPKEHLPRLFERFYRVDKARSRKLGGTGLGLSIVKHIAQVHGGRLTVESTPGKGSTFCIFLPKPGRLKLV